MVRKPQHPSIEYDEAKFRELIVYVASRMGEDTNFGATMLNKVLFYADFWHYAEWGTPITGAEYQRLRNGPAPRRLLPVQNALIEAGEARLVRKTVGRFQQKRLVPLRDADLSRFSAGEITFVDDVMKLLRDYTAGYVSTASHDFDVWRMAMDGETLPYEGALIYDGPVTDDDREHVRRVTERLGNQLDSAGAP
jgi:hypothetical protein